MRYQKRLKKTKGFLSSLLLLNVLLFMVSQAAQDRFCINLLKLMNLSWELTWEFLNKEQIKGNYLNLDLFSKHSKIVWVSISEFLYLSSAGQHESLF